MIETMRTAGVELSAAVGPLGMPPQAAPIDRTPAGAALAAGRGVEAAFGWEDIKAIAGGLGAIGDRIF